MANRRDAAAWPALNSNSSVAAESSSSNDPSHFHNSDSPGMKLISITLDEHNFVLWSKAVYLALGAKAKLGYIDGSLIAPTDRTSVEFMAWKRADCMVSSWILGAMSKELIESFISCKSARLLWLSVCERFDVTNGTKLFQLQQSVYHLKQGHDAVHIFFGKMQKLWDELDEFSGIKGCTCGHCTCQIEKQIQDKEMQNRLMQFLMGLSSEYEAARNQLLMLDPLPTVNRAYSTIQRIEQQKKIEVVEETPVFFSKTKGGFKPYQSSWTKGNANSQSFRSKEDKDKLICTHCGGRRHEASQCFKLHGYPDWYDKLKNSKKAAANCLEERVNTEGKTGDISHIIQQELAKYFAATSHGEKSAASHENFANLVDFAEHMLFYASEKYPLENSYSKYISEHGGSTNAFTQSEHTNYYFDVNPDGFEEALDRFSQFFIKPLLSADATTREIKAVDSENKKNLLSDHRRMNQLQKHISVKDHPYHKFSTGNRETLEIWPKERGVDTREELLRFYNEYYSANLMHLVIYSKDDLDESESMVRSKFQDIRNTDRSPINFPGKPCDSKSLQILVKAVPVKQGHKLKFVWPITPGIHYYKEGPSRYLGHLVGHEGEGSLFCILKKLGWATRLTAGESDWTNEYSFFKVNVDLTDAGNEHFEDIVALLFKYICLLQQSAHCQWIFDELAAICETYFHYQDKNRPIDYVVNATFNMRFYPPRDWLVGSSLPSKFNPERIQSALKELSPYNVRIFWESTKFEGLTDLKEPWYGTAYSSERLDGSTIEQWIERAPAEDLHLPVPNVFIPTDLSLKNVSEHMKLPVLLRKTQYSKLWYKPDTAFLSPKAFLKLDFNCPFSGSSPETEVLTEIFTRLLMDYLNEYAYDARVAGLYYAVSDTDFGFQVTVVGYNHKLRILLETVLQRLANFEVKPDRFAVIKELVVKKYQNSKFQQPYQQAMYNCSLILHDQAWPRSEKLEVLPHLQVEDLEKFYPLMLSRIFLECYAAGNLEPTEAESIIQHIEDVFFKGSNPRSQPLFTSQYMTNRIVELEKGKHYLYSTEGLNPSDENSALVHYIQVHQDDFKLNVTLELFAVIAKQPAFHQLRSVEQLGYITVLRQRNDSGVRGVQFIIQSTVKGPGQIDLKVESFLKMFETKLYEMPSDEFKSNVNALIDMKLEKHKNLRQESAFYWREISDGTFKFDRRECEVAALKQLTQKDLIDFFDEYIKVGAPRKKGLSIRVYGSAHSSEYPTDNSQPAEANAIRIEDIFSFRRSRSLYGSFKGGFGHMKL